MKEREILDNPNDGNLEIWLEKSNKMLLRASVGVILGFYSASQSKNESNLISFEDYPEIFGCFLFFVSTIFGFLGVKYWIKNFLEKEPNKNYFPIILVLQIIVLIPSIFGATQFIFTYCYRYLYSLMM